MSKTGHKRKMRILALQLCQEIQISTDKYTIRPIKCHFLNMRRIRQNYVNLINIAFSACVMNIFIGTRDKSVFFGSIVKPEVLSFVCDRIFSNMTK